MAPSKPTNNNNHSVASFIKEHWSILALVATGLVTWGITTADVAQLKADRDKAQQDHDLLVELRAEQRGIQADVAEIKQTVKELARTERKERRREENP